ncbi:MAG: DinB family protein [Gemmatimonadaceae bacterium]
MKAYSVLLALVVAIPAGAQSLPSARTSAHELWMTSDSYIADAAEQVPEARYGFKPTPEVRSFGEVVLHVASAHYLLCGIVLGEKEKELGKLTAKADLVAALKTSIQYCEGAYAISDADAMLPATVFEQPRTKLHALMTNAWHDNEHYGNIATYMRLMGMVPPSSQPKK